MCEYKDIYIHTHIHIYICVNIYIYIYTHIYLTMGFPGGSVVKNPPNNQEM